MIPIWRWLRQVRRGGGGPVSPPPAEPVADFTGTPLTGEVPLEVVYTNTSTDYASSFWRSGDGQTSTDQHATFTYAVAGTYSPKLTVTGTGGVDSKKRTGYVIADPDSGGDTLFDSGRIGGQVPTHNDYMPGGLGTNLMGRARNLAKINDTVKYGSARCLLKVVSLTRASDTTTVVLSAAPESYQGNAALASGYRLVLHCLASPTFEVEQVPIIRLTSMTFTYPNVGSDLSYVAVGEFDVVATTINSVAVGADGQPDEDCYVVVSTVSGTATANPDLDGTYTGTFNAGVPSGMVVAPAEALTNWTPGGGDNQFTLTVNGTDTAFITFQFSGLPGDFEMPVVVRDDHDAADFLRPDAAQILSRIGFLRFMDLGDTNYNGYIKSWSKRPLIACGLGMPLEQMIAMCNQLGCNMWYCFPHLAADDYITGAATLIRDTLDPELWCIFERSNEQWNGIFPHLAWDVTLMRSEMSAYFHGFYDENEVLSATKAAGVVTVTLRASFPVPFANGATAVFKITGGSTTGYNTADAGSVMTVSGQTFSFSGNSGSGTATCNEAMILGDPPHILYSDHLQRIRELAYRTHGWKTYEMSQLVSAVFGGLNDRARVVLMGWENNFNAFGIQVEWVFPWLEDQFGPMSDWCYGIGGAPYPDAGSAANLTQVMNNVDAQLDDCETRAAFVTDLCADLGVHHVQYEANFSLSNVSSHALIDSTHTNAVGGTMQRWIIDRMLANGVELQCAFTTWPNHPGIDGFSHWGFAGLGEMDTGAIGAATDERLKGFDAALLAPEP